MVSFYRFTFIVFCVLSLFTSCKPVNSLTMIMKTPDEYTKNYCCGEVAVPRSADRGNPWIVYSDRDLNPTYFIPGGKVKQKMVSYFEPLAVINEKGDYVEVVKYEKGVFEGRRVKDPSKAEYLGWMPKTNLILSSKAMTDVATGLVIKMITAIVDTLPLTRTEKFFTDGAVTLYGEPELLNPIGTIPFQKPVFLSKRSEDKDKCLVIGVEDIVSENTSSITSGWVSSSMLRPLGEMLYCDFSDMPIKRMTLSNSDVKCSIPKMSECHYLTPYKLPDFVGVNPVYRIEEFSDNTVDIKTTMPVSVIDNNHNMVYSIDGSPISRNCYDKMSVKLKNVNIMVVFLGQKEVDSKFNQYVNSLQQLDAIVNRHSKDFHFRLGYYVGFDAGNNELAQTKPCDNIRLTLQKLDKYAEKSDRKVKFTSDAWLALRQSINLLSDHQDEQNIVIVIGENGNQKELIDNALVNSLVNANCRIIGCQLFSNVGNSCNNFVLQVEDMISRSAEKLGIAKRKMLVHSKQVCFDNRYKEFSENVYGLDYPKNSMQQGWVVFPKKKEMLSPDLLMSVTDSMIGMIEYETENILSYINESFKKTGVSRTSINPEWLKLNGLPSSYQSLSNEFQTLSHKNPVSNYPARLRVESANLAKGKYMLFVTDSELNRIRHFIRDLLSVRVDYMNVSSNSHKKEKLRSCPDMNKEDHIVKAKIQYEYLNTSKVRRSMYKTYLRWARDEKVYPKKKSELKKMTLSRNQQEAFFVLSFDSFQNTTNLNSLKRRKMVSDSQLDKFQDYLLVKQKALEDAINNDNKYEFNGQTYYAIDADLLP